MTNELTKKSATNLPSNSNQEMEEIENFDIYEYFEIYNQLYFEGLLSAVILTWSQKMTSCAGTFSVTKKGEEIHLSEALLKYRSLDEIRETLLHEMIHAYCYYKNYDMSDDLSGHGKYFKAKMQEINKETGLHISVYHSFIDEVNLYAKYIWRCNGPCRNKPPYFGYVKRQMNRPPQKADKWWGKHLKECGGTFIRISPTDEELAKEKENKKKKEKENKKKIIKKKKNNDSFSETTESSFIHSWIKGETKENSKTEPKENKIPKEDIQVKVEDNDDWFWDYINSIEIEKKKKEE